MKKMSCMLLIFILVALSGCSYFLPTEDTAGNSMSNIDIVTTTQEVEQESTLSPYEQAYPVQDYQKAYARFLDTYGAYRQAFCIHIDEDEIPELVVNEDDWNAFAYGYDGVEVYEVCRFGLSTYSYDFHYRPYLGMTASFNGSVMYGDHHMIISTYEKEDGRLKEVDCIHIAPPAEAEIAENYGGCSGITHYYEYEDIIKYDTLGDSQYSLGESWKLPDEQSIVDDSKIQYWLNN